MAIPRDNHGSKQIQGRSAKPAAASIAQSAVATDAPGAWQEWLMRAAVIVLACFWVYSPVCHPVHHADWLWDDDQLLTANQTVQHRVSPDPSVPPDDAATLAKLWLNPEGADYFPLSYTAASGPSGRSSRWIPAPAVPFNPAARRPHGPPAST